ncbi:MAG: ATP-binding protein [Bacteroidia bacterium]|nr:ATP-binding protein [Bacteroidia bacterium]
MRLIKKYLWLMLTLLFLAALIVVDSGMLTDERLSSHIKIFQEIFDHKERKIDNILSEISSEIHRDGIDKWSENKAGKTERELNKNHFVIFIFRNDSLIYWSDNSLPVDLRFSSSELGKGLYNSGNYWCYARLRQVDNLVIAGLIRIKSEYSFENNLLINRINTDFHLPGSWKLSPEQGRYSIKGNRGEFLFSLRFTGENTDIAVPVTESILFFAVILSFFIFIFSFFSGYSGKKWLNTMVILTILCISVIRLLTLLHHLPGWLYNFGLFNPQYYGISPIFPSLGDLLINSIILFYSCLLIYRFISIKQEIKRRSVADFRTSVFWIIIVIFLYYLVIYLLYSLILHSIIPFELFRIFDLNFYTLAGFITIGLIMGSFILVTDKAVKICHEMLSQRQMQIMSGIVALIFLPAGLFILHILDILSVLFFILVFQLNIYVRYRNISFSYYWKIIYLSIVSLFVLAVIYITTSHKEQEVRQVLAVSLANERDPVAELLLGELETKLRTDSSLASQVMNSSFDKTAACEYIRKSYLEGYWNKYDAQLFFCDEDDSIEVQPDNISQSCQSFFSDIISRKGSPTSVPGFYFIDNFNGRINYMGFIGFQTGTSDSIRLYMDFNSRLVTEELGYPELLLDSRMKKTSAINNYSYAKYKDNFLISQSGDFPYSLSGSVYSHSKEEFSDLTINDYDHFVYNAGNNYSIVLSRPCIKILDILITLSYILVFFHILLSLSSLAIRFPFNLKDIRFGFKNKIQLTMISVLLISLLVVGSGMVYYYIRQFENKNIENLDEKIQSVLVELQGTYGNYNSFTHDMEDDLTSVLIRLSNVFYTDINIYDLKASLLASSRPEIFDKNLTGSQMDIVAFRQLTYNKLTRYIHDERIGGMKYLSVYVPLVNNNNQVLAWLNLPYFSKQSLLKREIMAVAVAMVNIYVLLIVITVIIAVVISNKITHPLQLIREKFRSIHLQRQNEPLSYSSNDEIGDLIHEYNRMVVELARSADLLAKSERESAWREMAKQIAHEIKNPLTPMKLNIQYLQKAWEDKSPHWEENFGKVTRILTEQIDSLSHIANEFSQFARLPRQNNREIHFVEILNAVILLLENECGNTRLTVDNRIPASLKVFADKEQIERAFINLIKNAIQSIPDERDGLVKIISELNENLLVVTIEDNGVGIPAEMRNRIFEPNFTTKTSGMGLGLAVARSIIEDSGGTIRFETSAAGTRFIVELPVKS